MRDYIVYQDRLPPEMEVPRPLPGVQPMEMADWLRVDDAFSAQMAARTDALATKREAVTGVLPEAAEALDELYGFVLDWLRTQGEALGFNVCEDSVTRPDGVIVPLDPTDVLGTLGQVVQEDFCLLQKAEGAAEHRLTAAVLCFPASWRLHEKLGRALIGIHEPVPPYDDLLAKRVQRLMDGVQVGRPLWRCNRLDYPNPELFQPEPYQNEAHYGEGLKHPQLRSERQVLLRLPKTRAVVFSIHTYVVRNVPA